VLSASAALTHPDTDPETRRPYEEAFGRWTNRRQLWDSLAPRLRLEIRRLGPSYSRDRPPARVTVIPAQDPAGSDLVTFAASYLDTRGQVVQRCWTALIATRPDSSGEVISRGQPLETITGDDAAPDRPAARQPRRNTERAC
jgi:hypothetical protein